MLNYKTHSQLVTIEKYILDLINNESNSLVLSYYYAYDTPIINVSFFLNNQYPSYNEFLIQKFEEYIIKVEEYLFKTNLSKYFKLEKSIKPYMAFKIIFDMDNIKEINTLINLFKLKKII